MLDCCAECTSSSAAVAATMLAITAVLSDDRRQCFIASYSMSVDVSSDLDLVLCVSEKLDQVDYVVRCFTCSVSILCVHLDAETFYILFIFCFWFCISTVINTAESYALLDYCLVESKDRAKAELITL